MMSSQKILAIVSFLFFWHSCAFGYTLEYTAAELREKIQGQFPHTIQKPGIRLVLSNPEVILEEGRDRLGIRLQLEALILAQPSVKGEVWMEGQLRYDPAQGALFVDRPEVKRFTIEGLPPEWSLVIQQLLSSRALQKHFEKYPVYQLKSDDPQQALAKLMLKAIYVQNGKLKIELSPF